MISSKRTIWSAILAVILDFYAFNFIPRNVNIIATRTPIVRLLDYLLNFIIFFLVIYIILTIIYYLVRLLSDRKK